MYAVPTTPVEGLDRRRRLVVPATAAVAVAAAATANITIIGLGRRWRKGRRKEIFRMPR